ncbi:MAG TPA: flavodoxin family protein [Geobacteraceae bacterium]|nr:flavodoxin family protein [Geobacteraceae bacterium]
MKITVINGSPKGRDSITNIMVAAFLNGARKAGAETVNIFLAEKEVKHCNGCFACWFATPGQCVIKDDDMAEILSQGEGSDILVLATPLKYANISSMLKVFIERLLVFANPYMLKDQAGETRHPRKLPETESSLYRSKLVLIANGGLGQRQHFQVVSHWIKRLALNNLSEVIGEYYAAQGPLLANPPEELQPLVENYLLLLEKAGKEIASGERVPAETEKLLEQNLIPDDIYLQQINGYFDSLLSNVSHPYVKAW